jgi:hypothetical protein
MSNQLIEYRSVLHKNSEVFLFNYKEEFAAFGFTDQYFDKFVKVISTKRMSVKVNVAWIGFIGVG